ncbi:MULTISPECIES: tetratricopeptide repeat protein [Anaeromyxobacter]|uniref:tetratricopeptide repeat protein n=1 Tax=Anaeromyxobacter TaxID=161492 RepID=UPI001F57BBB6|nr:MULTISPECIES: tetratricopeptide repeat protein [unclassified Anaeromyxobacter]
MARTQESAGGRSPATAGEPSAARPPHRADEPFTASAARRWAVPALLVLAIALTYGNALRNGFAWDDRQIIVENPTGHSLSNLGAVLTECDTTGGSTPYYRPLNRALYLLDYQLFGLGAWGYHLVSVLWHAAAALLLFVAARRLFRAELPAALAALLLAVHPIHAEPVNFISGRNNVVATALVLAALAAYLRARDEGRRAWYGVSLAAFFMGLLCKEPAIMLLPLLGVLEALSGAPWREVVRRRGPILSAFAGVAALYLGLRAVVLSSALGAQVSYTRPGEVLSNVLHIVPKYAAVTLFPRELTAVYSRPGSYFSHPLALVLAWLLLAIGTFAVLRRNRLVTRFGVAWAVLSFLPVSTIVWFPSAELAERYLYQPLVGVWLVLADQAWRLWQARPQLRRALGLAAVFVLVALAARTVARNPDWRDDRTLFASAVRVEPDNADAHFALGDAHARAGELGRARHEWDEALRLDPRNVLALTNLGTYYAQRGDSARAEQYFRRVLEVDERDDVAHFNLALIAERAGRVDEAVAHYRRFVETERSGRAELVAKVRERISALEGRPAADQ